MVHGKNLYTITFSVHNVTALRQDVKELVELVQKLVTKFRAVKIELEATHLHLCV